MACGTPVLALREGLVSEILGHGRPGFLYDDEAGMAEAILRVEELGGSVCRRAVEAHISAERTVVDHLRR